MGRHNDYRGNSIAVGDAVKVRNIEPPATIVRLLPCGCVRLRYWDMMDADDDHELCPRHVVIIAKGNDADGLREMRTSWEDAHKAAATRRMKGGTE